MPNGSKAWEFVDQRTVLLGEQPDHGLFAEDSFGNEMTHVVLQSPNLLVFVSYDLSQIPAEAIVKIENIEKQVSENGGGIVWLTASLPEELESWQNSYDFFYRNLFC